MFYDKAIDYTNEVRFLFSGQISVLETTECGSLIGSTAVDKVAPDGASCQRRFAV
ncbi:MAG: hypothetical protein J5582_02190 [Ruminococcus sp.]|uniref:hypothetical protein n=1 Tax=Ruminococcus sp. TaxID=41978 RepID=UPI0025F0E1E6|nr:hypothetical protein [Ruminococcus sp.]MBO4865368.1 hypothetical protein [Ruminococcus sp.]